MRAMAGRLDESMPVGNEGAGIVVKTGASDAAQKLLGRTVAIIGGGMYSQYRCVRSADCLVLPSGTRPAEGASCFVNPLTALGMVETMRREGHSALVHTAAASNLGQMLNKICIKDGVGSSISFAVRDRPRSCTASAPNMCAIPARRLSCDDLTGHSPRPGRRSPLTRSAAASSPESDPVLHGSGREPKCDDLQPLRLDGSQAGLYLWRPRHRPTELNRGFGMAWGVGGWLLTPFLQKIGNAEALKLRERVAAELKTTFSSHYSKVISLREALQIPVIAAYNKRATGEKYLINPQKDVAGQCLSFSEIGLARRSVRMSKLEECSNGLSGRAKADVYGPEISAVLTASSAYDPKPAPASQCDLRLPRKKSRFGPKTGATSANSEQGREPS